MSLSFTRWEVLLRLIELHPNPSGIRVIRFQAMKPPEQVPFFDCAQSFASKWPALRDLLHQVITRGKYSHGMITERFEQEFCGYTKARHAFAVNSGTDALILLLRCAGIGPGDEVIVPCFTFIASASSVVQVGATPIFVDVEPKTYTLDATRIEAAVTSRTRAIMPVHLFSQMADMTSILAIARRRNLLVLEDSAEAIGMTWGDTHAGLLGLGGVFSFFPTKTLGALGDAGMIVTDDDALAEKAHVIRHHGREGRTIDNLPGISHEAIICGTNSKMDEIQAAVLSVRLKGLEKDIDCRAQLAMQYDEGLTALQPFVQAPRIVERQVPSRPVYYCYVIEAERKQELKEFLATRGIGTEEYYPEPLHLQPCFTYLGYQTEAFPVAEAACHRTLALPLYPDLGPSRVAQVVKAVKDFYLGKATR